ncbi:MAG: S49 family peptidase [Rhodospirillales bacterium]|nr:S49 family peptidase [Rhodospirillales bacterium]
MDIHSLLARLPIKRFREPPPVVAVLRLAGVIGSLGPLRGGLTLAGLAPQLEKAFKLPRLQAVALAVNSPGGSPVQSALISQRIRDLAEEKKIPVIAFTEDVAASGGYWLACAADEIYANENSIVGSIGVISAGFGFPELLKRFGVERRVHTAGERKAMLDPFREENPKDVARLKALHKDIHDSFKAQVRERRGERLKGSEKTLFNGEVWTGRQALDLGLVDGFGELRHVLRQRYGDKLQLKTVESAKPWWRRRLTVGTVLPAPEDWAAGLIAAAEERALWSRYGL